MPPDEPGNTAVLAQRITDLSERMAESRQENNRRFDGVNAHMERRFATLEETLSRMSFVPRAEYDLLKERVASLEDTIKWFARALVASFALPIAVILFLQASQASP